MRRWFAWMCVMVGLGTLIACGAPVTGGSGQATVTPIPTATMTVPPTATPTQVPVDCLTRDGRKVSVLLLDYADEWNDAQKIAGATSRIALGPQVASIQDVRRKLVAESVPACGYKAQQALAAAIDSDIEMYLRFMRQAPEWGINQQRDQTEREFHTFTVEFAVMQHKPTPPPLPPPPPTATPYVYIPPTATPKPTFAPIPVCENAFTPAGKCAKP